MSVSRTLESTGAKAKGRLAPPPGVGDIFKGDATSMLIVEQRKPRSSDTTLQNQYKRVPSKATAWSCNLTTTGVVDCTTAVENICCESHATPPSVLL